MDFETLYNRVTKRKFKEWVAPVDNKKRSLKVNRFKPNVITIADKSFGEIACYISMLDAIITFPKNRFKSKNEYYMTLFHELCHATGAAHRLDRKLINGWANTTVRTYAKEELVAEIGAIMLGKWFLKGHDYSNHYNYIRWYSNEKIKNTKKGKLTKKEFEECYNQAALAADYVLDNLLDWS